MSYSKKRNYLGFVASLLAMVFVGIGCGALSNDDRPAAQQTADAGNTNDGGGSKADGGKGNSKNTGIPDPSKADLPDPANFDYSTQNTFVKGDILGGYDGVRAAEDPSIICTEGCDDNTKTVSDVTLYPIDSGFGWDLVDFQGGTERPRDGNHEEGWVGTITNDQGDPIGLALSTVPTQFMKTGHAKGQWCGGLGGHWAKCKSHNYTVLEHILTCHESVPYMYFDPVTGMPTNSDYSNCPKLDDQLDKDPATLTEYEYDLENMASSTDYSVIVGEEPGDYKIIWGNRDKRPTDIRLVSRVDLPDEWLNTEQTYEVTEAKLAIVHTTTNNPNDKIKPEDIDTEDAAGRLPRYEVKDDGRWVSTVDCYEGDGDFIPKGTTFKNPTHAQPDSIFEDLEEGFTNAWYTTLDREPFEKGQETGPRWRLKAPKFGQDLPGVEIPTENCNPGPLKKDQIKYSRGTLTTTVIDLLDPMTGGGESPFKVSSSFTEPVPSEQVIVEEGLTTDGVTLTDKLDLSLHIKGERNPTYLYKAALYLNYEPAGN